MNSTKRELLRNPRASANVFSVIFFGWTLPIFKKGIKKKLDDKDICEPLKCDHSELLGDRLDKSWQLECKTKKNPSLAFAICKTFRREIIILGIMTSLVDIVFRLAIALAMERFLAYFSQDSELTYNDAMFNGIVLFIITLIIGMIKIHLNFTGCYYGMRVRVAISSIIYKKALRLSQKILYDTAPAKLVNLLSNDIQRFDRSVSVLHYAWTSPILTIIAAYIMWMEIRWAAIMGVAVTFLFIPIQSYVEGFTAKFRLQTALQTDNRIRFMNEIITGIQAIKFYTWEQPFAKLVKNIRYLELKTIEKGGFIRGFHLMFINFNFRLAIFISVSAVAMICDYNIKISKIFMIASLFEAISIAMVNYFIRSVTEIPELLVSIKRFQQFLEYEEKIVKKCENNYGSENYKKSNSAVSFTNFSAQWNKTKGEVQTNEQLKTYDNHAMSIDEMNFVRPLTLQNINVEIPKGKLIAIIGSVGAGKSSLLQAILHELSPIKGSMEVNGTISFASQEPWIFAETVRQNITFGQSMNKKRYNSVVKRAALERDFEQFSAGDLTFVGERGISLSGGQKARINLARAMYRQADIYLFDDPLSAVDAHVGSHLFSECMGPNSFLAEQNSTRILVTHHIHFLKDADSIILLENGEIKAYGKYDVIGDSDIEFLKMLNNDEKGNNVENEEVETKENKISEAEKPQSSLLEEIKIPNIKHSLLLTYFKSANKPFLFWCSIGSFLLTQILLSGADIWISKWKEHHKANSNSSGVEKNIDIDQTTDQESWDVHTYVTIYAIIMILLLTVSVARSVAMFCLSSKASQNLHDTMFNRMTSTSLRFFNLNPSGRILNRFSKDMGTVDELLPRSIFETAHFNLLTIGSLLVTVYTDVKFLIIIFVMTAICFYIRKIYLKVSMDLRRIEGITKSPVYTHIAETLNGLPTIRALNAVNLLDQEFNHHQDLNSGTWYMFLGVSWTFSMSLDILLYIFVGCIIFSFLVFNEDVSGNVVGLALNRAVSLTSSLQWGVQISADMMNNLASVERILEYSELEAEKQPEIPKDISMDWPSDGKIEFRKVFYRYSAENNPILRDLSIKIEAKEKIGIVGRTGAGKSSLIGSLFRLAFVEGEILIDDVDTAQIELKLLRSRISIMPQDAVLFSGTLRRNVDPFEEYSDQEIWAALENVELKKVISEMEGLEMKVLTRGANFSVGQRQLICMARALLRNNRILVLDEATANVDPKTDQMIQRTIREKFGNCTVLTVAHRLHTIIDSDRVLVMGDGVAVEFDTPHSLLQKHDGVFCGMVKALGAQEYDRMLAVAKLKSQK